MNPPTASSRALLKGDEDNLEKSPTEDLKSDARRFVPQIIITGEILLRANIIKIPPLIDPIFPQVGIVAVGGSSDTGKSCFLNQLAMAIVSGENEFLGFPLNPTHYNVIYVSTEDDPQAIAFRLEMQNIYKYQPNKLSGLRYWFDSENLLEILDRGLKEQKADCVIIDAFSDIFGDSDINQVGKVRGVLNAYRKLANDHKCLFIFLHHTGKRTDDGAPSKHDLLGSQGFEAKMRAVLLIRKDRHDESVRHLVVAKGNYLPPEIKNRPFVLRFENLVFSNTGKRIDRESLADNITKEWHLRAIELHDSGMVIREIEKKLKLENFESCSRGSIHNLIKRYGKKPNSILEKKFEEKEAEGPRSNNDENIITEFDADALNDAETIYDEN